MDARQRSTKLVTALFAISLLLRLLALMIFPPPDLDDSARGAYLRGAHLLVEGKGFSDPSYPVGAPPLYAIFISICLSLFGDDQLSVKIFQAFVDSTMIIVVYYIIREIFDTRTGFLSAAILTIYPFSTYLTISIASEPLFTFFLSLFVLLTVYAVKFQKWQYYSAAGILLGLATLTRGTTQFFPLMFIIMLVPFTKLGKEFLLAYMAFCLSFALVILPWTLRNYVVLEDFIPVATSGGITFLQGSSEKFFTVEGKNREWPAYFEALRAKGIEAPPKGSKPSQTDKFNTRATIENYRSRLENDPLSFVPFLGKKFFRLWYATESGDKYKDGIILVVNLFIYPFALAGLVLAWVEKRPFAWLPFCALLYFVVLHWISLPLFRYMIPVMPYVIGFAAFTFTTIFKRFEFPDTSTDKTFERSARYSVAVKD